MWPSWSGLRAGAGPCQHPAASRRPPRRPALCAQQQHPARSTAARDVRARGLRNASQWSMLNRPSGHSSALSGLTREIHEILLLSHSLYSMYGTNCVVASTVRPLRAASASQRLPLDMCHTWLLPSLPHPHLNLNANAPPPGSCSPRPSWRMGERHGDHCWRARGVKALAQHILMSYAS